MFTSNFGHFCFAFPMLVFFFLVTLTFPLPVLGLMMVKSGTRKRLAIDTWNASFFSSLVP